MEQSSSTIFLENPDEFKKEWLKEKGEGVFGEGKAKLTITKQCELLKIQRTSFYRKHVEPDRELELLIKGRIDYWHTMMPYLGVRRLREKLREDDKKTVDAQKAQMNAGRKLIAKYMREMGIYAVYPRPNLSKRNKRHKIYPYLLRNKVIAYPNQVWAIDITYIKMSHGHMYLTGIIDWYSRYIVGWALSDTLDKAPVLEAVKVAMERYGVPSIINSDQGSQFTSREYTEFIKSQGVLQSMDGKARWIDNVIIERWFRSFKTEWLYVNEIVSPRELRKGIACYVEEYNTERPHQSLKYMKPVEAFRTVFREAA